MNESITKTSWTSNLQRFREKSVREIVNIDCEPMNYKDLRETVNQTIRKFEPDAVWNTCMDINLIVV